MKIVCLFFHFVCRKCEGNIEEALEQEGKLSNEGETVREFTYIGDMVSTGRGSSMGRVISETAVAMAP